MRPHQLHQQRYEDDWNEDFTLNREKRVFNIRTDPLDAFNQKDFREHFRMNKETFVKVSNLIKKDVEFDTNRGLPLNANQALALAITFYTSGTFQRICGHISGVKKSCSCNTIARVSSSLCGLAKDVITVPSYTEMQETADYFEEKYGLPNFAYGVDGCFMRLEKKPAWKDLIEGQNPQDFWCRDV